MRFAYIDSQGNEVSIPSVDALALRIELGAIGPDTELYDEQADRWGPAQTHEIFHTLSRSADAEGFVAPPPPVAPAPEMEEPETEEPETEAPVGEEPEPAEEEPEEEAPGFDLGGGLEFEDDSVGAEEPEAAEASGGDDLGLDLTLSDAPAEEPAVEAPAADDSGFGDLGFDLAEPPGAEPSADAPAEEEEEEEGGFDFGDLSGGLELESADTEEEPAMDLGGGMESESPMGFAGGGDSGIGGGMELEQPMSEFVPDAPPAWMEQDGPDTGGDDAMDLSSPAAPPTDESVPPPSRVQGDDDEAPRERPKSRSRPSPPRRRKKLPVGMILGGIGIGVVGVGGFFGWQVIRAGGGEEAEEVPALPPVVIPDIPAELLPQMRDMAEDALAAMLDDLRRRSTELETPPEPRPEWLGGDYLGNASRFSDIAAFWLGIGTFVDEVRDTDMQLFHDRYVEQVQAEGFAADTAAMLIERADSGFVAARDGRFEAYAMMDDLVNAALDLHQFLLDNEDQITYEPAAGGMSRDPVLEAVPATEALGDEMWESVDRITGALDALGTLDKVTTERLFAVLFDRIRRAGIY